MKYIWEEKDVICGRFVCRGETASESRRKKDMGWHEKWTYKIGFHAGRKTSCLIAMTDGMVMMRDRTPLEIAEYLTENNMIPAPHSWMIELITDLRDCYEPE